MKKLVCPVFIMFMLALTIGGCKKNETTTNNQSNYNPLSTQIAGTPDIPANAAGALYAIKTKIIADDGSGILDTTKIGFALAWFDSPNATKNAGTVSCNDSVLTMTIPFSNVASPWYNSNLNGIDMDFYNSDNVVWKVQGNSSTGVPAFNYTDNVAFPGVTGFNLPASVDISANFTVNYGITGQYDGLFFMLSGSKGRLVVKGVNNATSITFTPAQLSQVSVSGGDDFILQIMPVKVTSTTFSGKTYYFIKQFALDKTLTTM
jgi:hypothetical protein